MAKEAVLWCVLVVACLHTLNAEKRIPSVHVFTRYPVEIGKENTVQCYVDGFHPPKITITLLKNGQPMESQQSDLSFNQNWAFHRLVFANTTMDANINYACRVEHETLAHPRTVELGERFSCFDPIRAPLSFCLSSLKCSPIS
uniref:beta-2-microglobulin n=1 Tax=Euleptes europaea TaxID=460621 RepID=UPI002540412A|nr:beta-2-microglobulin [Euleptes europaea]